MPSILEGIITELETNADVAALVGSRIRASYAKQGETLPYIVVTQTDGAPSYHATGEDGLQESQLSIRFYARTVIETVDGADKIRLAISGRNNADMSGVFVRSVVIDDIRDAYVGPAGEGDEVGYPATEVLATVWHSIVAATF